MTDTTTPPTGASDRRELYPISPTRRPSHIVVRLPPGAGTNPTALAAAIKHLTRSTQNTGLSKLFHRESRLFRHTPRSQKLRAKSRVATAKAVRKFEAWERRHDPEGAS